jgi:hypothetical protein
LKIEGRDSQAAAPIAVARAATVEVAAEVEVEAAFEVDPR